LTMDEQKEQEPIDTPEKWIGEYRLKWHRKFLRIFEKERRAKFAEGLFPYFGEWRTIEEIVYVNLQEKRRKNAILIDLLLLLVFSVVLCLGALYALFRWYK